MKKLHNEHLDWLEAESVYIIREVAAECRNPALLFSGGKDSVVLLALARKAFHVAGRNIPLPFPLLHIDTGHNYPEVIAFRDETAARYQARLIVGSVEDSIARGTVVLRRESDSRNAAQAVTLLEAIEENGFDALLGGSTTRACTPAKTCASSPSPTGQSSTSGNTSPAKNSRCRRFTTRTRAKWWSGAACSSRSRR